MEAGIHSHHFYSLHQTRHASGLTSCRTDDEESAGSLRHPHEGSKTKGLIRPSFSILGSRGLCYPSQRWTGGNPKVPESVIHRVGLTTVRTPEIPPDYPSFPNLMGQKDETELWAAKGAGEAIGEKKMHSAPVTSRPDSREGFRRRKGCTGPIAPGSLIPGHSTGLRPPLEAIASPSRRRSTGPGSPPCSRFR